MTTDINTLHAPATRLRVNPRAGAVDLAYVLVRSLCFLREIDVGEATVSEVDAEYVRHRVCCDRLLPDRRRCALRAEHDGACGGDRDWDGFNRHVKRRA